MKKVFLFLMIPLVFSGCEDVIEIDAPAEEPRLAVDALIRIDENEPITTVRVSVALTSSFFSETQTATLEQITISNEDIEGTLENPNVIILLEVAPGVYEAKKNTSFFTEGELILQIRHEGQRYLARTRYVPSVPIDNLEQGTGTLFSGDETEMVVSFTDNPNRRDFYLFDFDFGEYLVTEDEFYQGQRFEFSYFYDEGLKEGREVNISLLGVDESFFNYMNQLIVQSGGDQGPFQTPAATVRGNIINTTEIDNVDQTNNFALGYFAVCQTFSDSLIIQ